MDKMMSSEPSNIINLQSRCWGEQPLHILSAQLKDSVPTKARKEVYLCVNGKGSRYLEDKAVIANIERPHENTL
jgi:hypothetical protein